MALTVDPPTAVGLLGGASAVIVALSLVSWAARASQVPDADTIVRERLWVLLLQMAGLVSVLVGAGTLTGGLTGSGSDLLVRLVITALAVFLVVLASSGVPTAGATGWAHELDIAEATDEARRYGRAADRWQGLGPALTRGWWIAEVLRWWTGLATLLSVISYMAGDPSSWLRALLGNSLLAALGVGLGAVQVRYVLGATQGLVDREISTTLMFGLMSIVVGLTAVLTAFVLVAGPLPTAVSILGAVTTVLPGVAAPVLTLLGVRRRWPRWRWFRPGLGVRTSVHYRCLQRRRRLQEERSSAPVTWKSRIAMSSLRRRVIESYDRMSGVGIE